ncbi:hypothetical protein E1A91_A11G212200v1 [Gossypium mustelinum]|uniref:Uncharacterized protein n=1 Tax=Gossypium mustelinum TaxID=34275 RepID=A0A5D2X927_GOSMU|nr:hypothetical protein E1A91_A11G212200v1 [Gossypium mustelinum]
MIVAESIPIEIPNIMACNPAYASAANEDETLLLRTVFNARISPIRPRTTRLEVDLEFFFCQSCIKLNHHPRILFLLSVASIHILTIKHSKKVSTIYKYPS